MFIHLSHHNDIQVEHEIPSDVELTFACLAELIHGRPHWPIFQQLSPQLRETTRHIYRLPYTTLNSNDRLRVDCSLLRHRDCHDLSAIVFVVHTAIRI